MAARLVFGLLIALLAGCTAQNVYQGVYEGVRVRSQLQSTPAERLGKPELPPDYERYDRVRGKAGD